MHETTGSRHLESLILSKRQHRMKEIRDYPETDLFRRTAKPVGRLAMTIDTGNGKKVGYCTASLIDEDLILTNSHCIFDNPDGKVVEALLWMGLIDTRRNKGVKRYEIDLAPLEKSNSRGLDYAIHRVKGQPGKDWGTIGFATDPAITDGQSLFIIHHPAGDKQHISLGNCQAGRPAIEDDDLLHTCDTIGGSSGAPVFVLTFPEPKVVGLHYRAVEVGALNAGKRIASIAQASPLIARLASGRSPEAPAEVTALQQELAELKARLTEREERAKASEEAPPKARETTAMLAVEKDTGDFPQLTWKMPTPFSGGRAMFGAAGFSDKVLKRSGGKVKLKLSPPDSSYTKVFEDVREGALDAGWSYFGFDSSADKEPAFSLLSGSIPVGLGPRQLVDWAVSEVGRSSRDAAFAKLDLVGLPCGIRGARGLITSAKIEAPSDLKNLNIRTYSGVEERITKRLGAKTINIVYAEVYTALKSGIISGAIVSGPENARATGFGKLDSIRFYYPAWDSTPMIIDFVLSRTSWQALDPKVRTLFRAACVDNLTESLAQMQLDDEKALEQMRKDGASVSPLPASVTVAARKAAFAEAEAIASQSKLADDVWKSLKAASGAQ